VEDESAVRKSPLLKKGKVCGEKNSGEEMQDGRLSSYKKAKALLGVRRVDDVRKRVGG